MKELENKGEDIPYEDLTIAESCLEGRLMVKEFI